MLAAAGQPGCVCQGAAEEDPVSGVRGDVTASSGSPACRWRCGARLGAHEAVGDGAGSGAFPTCFPAQLTPAIFLFPIPYSFGSVMFTGDISSVARQIFFVNRIALMRRSE